MEGQSGTVSLSGGTISKSANFGAPPPSGEQGAQVVTQTVTLVGRSTVGNTGFTVSVSSPNTLSGGSCEIAAFALKR